MSTVSADERHPIMSSQWWVTAGTYQAERDFDASANIAFAAIAREFDFESSLGLNDSPDLFMAEIGWQFSDKWGLATQYFRSSRSGSRVLEDTFEWQDIVFDVGATADTSTEMEITRIFFARRFNNEDGPHSLRIGAGLHWLSLEAEVSGEVRLNDMTTDFRRAAAKAEFPFPNIGAWYRYSPNVNWLMTARVDWLSAGIDNYSGDIWNVSAGVNYRLWDHIGIGVSYQYFELGGSLKEPKWRGEIRTTYSGLYLHLSAFW